MKLKSVALFALLAAPLLLANEGGCDDSSAPAAVTREQASVNRGQEQLLRNQPIPVYDWSLQREMMIKLYDAQQHSMLTYTYAQSPFTGKVLWSCPSMGFPIPGGTQLTNPLQGVVVYNPHDHDGAVAVGLPEPNGLYPPATSQGTLVMCLGHDGSVHPAYVEPNVEAFTTPMVEQDGKLVPTPDGKASFSIQVPK